MEYSINIYYYYFESLFNLVCKNQGTESIFTDTNI